MLIKNKKKFNQLVSSFVRKKREAATLSLRELSFLSNVNKNSIADLEHSRSKDLSFVNLFNVFSALKISQNEWDEFLDKTLS